MPQIINTNIASLNAQRNLNMSQSSLNTALQRLSSGLRINSAKDDAAGLAISMRMTSQIRSLNQAVRNANDGISMIQTGESGMQEIQNMLVRMKELATQGSSDTIGSTERNFLKTEIDELMAEINNIADRTEFNGMKLLNGSVGVSVDATSEIKVGTDVGSASVTNISLSGAKIGETYTFTGGGSNLVLTDGDGNAQAIDLTGVSLNTGDTYTLNFNTLGVRVTLQAAVDGYDGADIVTDLTTGANDTLVTANVGQSVTIQVGSSSGAEHTVALSFSNVKIEATGSFSGLYGAITALDGTRDSYTSLLDQIESALDTVSTQRAALGAQQNRLEYSVASTQTTVENLSAARSRVMDADFAAETAALTRGQILQQAGVAVLAQANALPQNVLALLR